jgi:hypothetical protein
MTNNFYNQILEYNIERDTIIKDDPLYWYTIKVNYDVQRF